ncbi:hypothetical protein [Cetobacterium somerae]|uniref:hypothetical protein n=1 Tax=Cetobacterium somerae TaxID=188913 RepID=UPI00248F108C|nr:hypothetical protein [Cetobacterium somerae]
MIAAINEFERTNLLERQREGILTAKELESIKGVNQYLFQRTGKIFTTVGKLEKSQVLELWRC